MQGLQKILKQYGRMSVKGTNGKEVWWVWDYANDLPKLESEMTKEEKSASERAKWESIKQLKK